MPRVVTTDIVDDETLARILTPRADLLAERDLGEGRFECAEGPFDDYRRTVVVADTGEGDHEVTQTTDFRLAIPVWSVFFNGLVKQAIRADRTAEATDRKPWWAPPDRLDARGTRALSLLCVLAYVSGYLGTLLTQTNTFAKDEFGSTDSEVTTVLAVVRVAALLALGVTAIADRRGRRTLMVATALAGCVLTATGALAPSLALLGASQTLARTASTALAVIIGIYAVEEMPAGSRAFAVSVLGMTGALGAGACVIFLPLADLGTSAWRILYLLPLLLLPGIVGIGRALPETRRFEVADVEEHHLPVPAADPAALVHSDEHPPPHPDDHRLSASGTRRFLLLAVSALLLGIFTTPASQLLNDHLREVQGFSALQITLFTILTNTPGGIGVVVGGRLADTRGRRIVGAVAVVGGVGFTVLMYLGSGAIIWVWSILGAIIGAAALPALGVYGPELFPTARRGLANGGINVLRVAGDVIGLLAAGYLISRLDGLPQALTVLALGPMVVAVLIVALYPETAQRELEELNPQDRPPPRGTRPLAALDEEYGELHPGHGSSDASSP